MSRLDLLLVDPPRVYWGFGGGLGFFSPPVGLATLAGFLERNGVQVDVLDCNAREIGWDMLAAEVRSRDPRCVGVSSSMTCYVSDAFRCLEIVKQANPDICTIGGGLQFTLAPGESLEKCESLDVIVRGDGEQTSLELLAEHPGGVAEHPGGVAEHPGGVAEHPGGVAEHPGGVAEHPGGVDELRRTPSRLEKVRGLSFRRGGEIVHNPDRQPVMDLDTLPLPAWHMLPMADYRLPVVPPEWGNYAIVVTTRGCPYDCSFCSPRAGQAPYRAMTGERVLEMLDDLYYQHDTRVFWFSDLSFNVNSERTEQILDGIIERGWKVRIAFDGTRTDLIIRDRHLLPKMKKAGVFLICLGVESYSEQELVDYRKGSSQAHAEEAIALIKQHRINTCLLYTSDAADDN